MICTMVNAIYKLYKIRAVFFSFSLILLTRGPVASARIICSSRAFFISDFGRIASMKHQHPHAADQWVKFRQNNSPRGRLLTLNAEPKIVAARSGKARHRLKKQSTKLSP